MAGRGRTGGRADRRKAPGEEWPLALRGAVPPVRPSARSATLVIQTAFLGDVVLTTPLLTALAERHGPVDVVMTPAAAALLEGHPAVREVIRYDKRGRDAGSAGSGGWAPSSATRRYARAYLPHRSLAVGRAGAPGPRAGAHGLRGQSRPRLHIPRA